MGVLDKLEGGIEDAFDKAGARVFKGTIEPAQVARRAEKQMKREKLVGAGKQYAPTLYTVLVSEKDDRRLFSFYPTIAAEIETYLMGRGADAGLTFDGRPLVRFIVDNKLRSGRFDVIAENVASPIIEQLRDEEAEYLGLKPRDVDFIRESGFLSESSSAIYQAGPDSGLRAALRQVHGNSASNERMGFSDRGTSGDTLDDEDIAEPAIGDACLFDHATGQQYPLDLTKMTIGRGEDNSIVLPDANASRRHALFRQNVLGTWRIMDNDSTNGTLVNGKAVEQMVLRDGDELTIGVTVLEFIDRTEKTKPATHHRRSLAAGELLDD